MAASTERDGQDRHHYRLRGSRRTASTASTRPPRRWSSSCASSASRGATVLEVGGGVGELQIELLKAGAARAQNLELSPAYEQQAHTLAEQAGVQGRLDWRIHNLAADPGAVAPADLADFGGPSSAAAGSGRAPA